MFWFFLVLSLLEFVALASAVEAFSLSGGAGVLIVFAITLALFGYFMPFVYWVMANPVTFVLLILANFVYGAFYAIFKWYLYNLKVRDKYLERKQDWLESLPGKIAQIEDWVKGNTASKKDTDQLALFKSANGQWTDELKEFWNQRVKEYGIEFRPSVSQHKEKITTWIVFCVPSTVWMLIRDPITNLSNFIYHRIAATLNRISESVWGKV